ncbi:MAG: outer membrane protein assembly factor BamE [Marinobacter sp.]|nr:outer membrane protein assembly factor BamE [Marinobacter sp.]
MRSFIVLLLILLSTPAWSAADIYRCESGDGIEFSDTPCNEASTPITLQDNHIGGRFNTHLPPATAEPEAAEAQADTAPATPGSPCRYINSTTLRTHLVRNEVIAGMTREQVLKAFGRPPETYPVPQETWVYQTDYYGKLYELTYVYFRDGCVESVVYRKP